MGVVEVAAEGTSLMKGLVPLMMGCTGMVVRRPRPSNRPDKGVGDCDIRAEAEEERTTRTEEC